MSVFRALVVDNDEWVREIGQKAADPGRGIEIMTAEDEEQALTLIADHFFNVAVVDMELSDSPRARGEGLTILRALKRSRPSCRRLLLTMYATKYPANVFEMLRPDGPIIHGAIDKEDLGTYFRRFVMSLAEAWHRAPVEVSNLDEVHSLLEAKKLRSPMLQRRFPVKITEDELRYVLASLFGQRYREVEDDDPDPDDVEEISLAPFSGGKSRSIVLHGRPVNRLGEEGLLCVVKVGSREETDAELRRYEQYVRFRMSLRQRVELLGSVLGDTLGAIAYSFAGDDPTEVGDLQTLLDQGDSRAFAHFDEVLPESLAGSDGEARGQDIGEFFHKAYGLKPRDIADRIDDFADDLAEVHGWNRRRNKLSVRGGQLVLPTDSTFGAGLLHIDFYSTVVHGDLNGSNVIVGDDQRSILIDYRHTSRGPRALDYASMHASIRLSQPAQERPLERVARDETEEYRLWQHDWSSGEEWWPEQAPDPPPYWLAAAAHLMALAAVRLPDLTRAEYAATCWLYALRVFRVQSLPSEARLRMLIWMSALQRVMADERPPAADTRSKNPDA
jgi:CheY-like chemotaxis protein